MNLRTGFIILWHGEVTICSGMFRLLMHYLLSSLPALLVLIDIAIVLIESGSDVPVKPIVCIAGPPTFSIMTIVCIWSGSRPCLLGLMVTLVLIPPQRPPTLCTTMNRTVTVKTVTYVLSRNPIYSMTISMAVA